jgi:hypothetical protein
MGTKNFLDELSQKVFLMIMTCSVDFKFIEVIVNFRIVVYFIGYGMRCGKKFDGGIVKSSFYSGCSLQYT